MSLWIGFDSEGSY